MASPKGGPSFNPNGPLPVGDAQKAVRKLTRLEFEMIGNKFLKMTTEDMERAFANKAKMPVIEVCIMSILYHAIKEGDQKRLDWITDRLIGSPVRKYAIVVTDEEEDQSSTPVQMSNQERIDMLEKYAETLRKEKEVIDVSPNARKDKS